jgi:DNA-binding NtrC family response regulator
LRKGKSGGANHMPQYRGLIFSKDKTIITLCEETCPVDGVVWCSQQNLADFFLELFDNDFQVILFDCNRLETDCLQWVSFVRKLRPRVPLITVSDQCGKDKGRGAKLLQEGVFYICQRPVSEEVLTKVLASAIKQFHHKK